MVGESSEVWETTGVMNKDTPGHEIAIYKLVLTGFMAPSVFPGQKILYQVAKGCGLYFNEHDGAWWCHSVKTGDIVDVLQGGSHFFCSPDGEMEISVTSSIALIAMRQVVPAPDSFSLIGEVAEVLDGGSIICLTAIGKTPPHQPSQPVAVGAKIRIIVDFSVLPAEDDMVKQS